MKRLIKYALCLLAFGLTIVSCSQDDSVLTNTHLASDKAIGFSSAVGDYSTRSGIPTTPENYLEQIKNFSVWSYFPNTTDSSYYIGKRDSLGTIIRGDGTGKWYYQKPTDVAYWPLEGSLNFFALTPANSEDYTFTNEGVYYNARFDYNTDADVMVANADNQSLSNGNGIVNFNFKHALCQIRFKFSQYNNVRLEDFQRIEIHNVNSIASIPLFSKNIPEKSEYKTDFLRHLNGTLIIPPQKISGWDGNSTISNADASHKVYIVVYANIYQNKEVIARSPLYIPISDITLEAGKCYTFNIVLDNSAKKEDGTSAYTKVDYSVETTDWQIVPNTATINATMVDLGLASGTKWARNNIGANNPSELGNKYAWAETSTKSDDEFTFENYKYSWGEWSNKISPYDPDNGGWTYGMTKYLNSTTIEPNDDVVKDYVDNKVVLESDDDAATVNWGADWKTPTKEQWEELIKWCTFETTTLNGNNVFKVTGPNGNYIYMPKEIYMTSTLDKMGENVGTSEGFDYNFCCFATNMTGQKPNWENNPYRWEGRYVRPVLK